MSQLKQNQFEEYLLAQDKQAFLNSIIPGTYQFYYLKLMHLINSCQDQDQVQQFAQEYGNKVKDVKGAEKELYDGLIIKMDLNQLADEQDPLKVKELINRINDKVFGYTRFDYRGPDRKVNLQNKKGDQQVSEAGKTELTQNDLDELQTVSDDVYHDLKKFNQLSTLGLRQLDIEKLLQQCEETNNLDMLDTYFQSIKDIQTIENIDQILKRICKIMLNQPNKPKEIVGKLAERFKIQEISLEQLEKFTNDNEYLGEDNKQLFMFYLLKKYPRSLELIIDKDHGINKIKCTKEIYEELKEVLGLLKTKSQKIRNKYLAEFYDIIIHASYDLEIYDQEIFFEFLEFSKIVLDEKLENVVNSKIFQHVVSNYNNSRNMKQNITELHQKTKEVEVLKAHVKKLVKENQLERLYEYIDKTVIDKMRTKYLLLRGEHIKDADKFFSENELSVLANKKNIKLMRDNAKQFKVDEPITLKVKIKNVQKIDINIFQLNCEQFYLAGNSSIDGSISLDGLVPNFKQKFENNEPSFCQKVHIFKFDSESIMQQGVYLIEFVGNGISSRAIIQKGNLFVVNIEDTNGNILKMYDQDRNQVSINSQIRQGVYIDSQFYKLEKNGQIFVPFKHQGNNKELILVNGGFAKKQNVNIYGEQLNFSCGIIYNQETVVSNNVGQFMLNPKLSNNGQSISLELVKQFKVLISQTNKEGILNKTTQNISIKQLIELQKQQQQMGLQVQIIKDIQLIRIDLEVVVDSVMKKTVKFEPRIFNQKIDQQNSNERIMRLYLKKNRDGYFVYCLGKSGEPKKQVYLKLSIKSTLKKDALKYEMVTNDEGYVKLGKIEKINQIEACCSDESCIWPIIKDREIIYQSDMDILEGQVVRLDKIESEKDVFLYSQLKEKQIMEIQKEQITIDNREIVVQGLKEGDYLLKIGEQSVDIRVHKGIELYNQHQQKIIVTEKNKVIELKNIQQDNTMIQELAVDGNKLSVQTGHPNQQIVAIGFSFYDEYMQAMLNQMSELMSQQKISNGYFQEQFNRFLNNKTLSDEMVYVLDRKNREPYVGNYLEQPKILLNKKFNQKTTLDKEILKDAMGYTQNLMAMNQMCGAPRMQENSYAANRMMQEEYAVYKDGFNGQLKFLKKYSKMYQAKTKEDKKAEIEIDVEYQQLLVMTYHNDQWIYRLVDLENSAIKTKNLVQQLQTNSSKVQNKMVKYLRKGEKIVFEDMEGMEYQILDNLDQVNNLWTMLQKKSISSKWKFILEWDDLSIDEKHKKYCQMSSHELNIFLYFKDKAYFEVYVSQFIANKLEKTVVDYFLLQNEQEMQKYRRTELFDKLNPMEKSLVGLYFYQTGDMENYKRVVKNMESRSTKIEDREFDRLVESILNSQIKGAQTDNQPLSPSLLRGGPHIQQANQMDDLLDYQDFGEIQCQMEQIQSNSGLFGASRAAPRMMNAGAPRIMNAAPPGATMIRGLAPTMMAQQKAVNMNQRQQQQEVNKPKNNLQDTQEYIERQYYQDDVEKNIRSYFQDDLRFYLDFLLNLDCKQDFLSYNVFNSMSELESIILLSLIDLGSKSKVHKVENYGDKGISIEASQNMMIVVKELVDGKTELSQDILIGQRYFDSKKRYVTENGLKREKNVNEYIVNNVYGCQLIVTNSTITQQSLQLLFQIPAGALPVNKTDLSNQIQSTFQPYSTNTYDFYFYFPHKGTFLDTPAQVSRNNVTIGIAKQQEILVNESKTQIDQSNIDDILGQGDNDQIIKFVKERNLHRRDEFNSTSILHLLKDKEFYQQIIQIYDQQYCTDELIYSFSIYHSDKPTFIKLIEMQRDRLKHKVKIVQNSMITINVPQLTEYYPVINSRVHSINNRILNRQLEQQYHLFVRYLCETQSTSNDNLIVLIYYLLLQDRIAEAIKVFQKVDQNKPIICQIQFDYLQSYLDFYIGAPEYKISRQMCDKYLDYPILHWRNYFYEIANLLAEYDGEQLEQQEILQELQENNKKNKEQDQQLQISVKEEKVIVDYMNIDEIQLNIYQIDLETLFSLNPFVLLQKQDSSLQNSKFNNLIANHQLNLQLSNVKDKLQSMEFSIPSIYQKSNLYIMLRSDQKQASCTYFPNNLKIQLNESQGELRVFHEKKGLEKIYIKCYVKLKNGKTQFYKDGYTDIVGKFNYLDSSNTIQEQVQSFALLISSDSYGCLVQEAKVGGIRQQQQQEIALISQKQRDIASKRTNVQSNTYHMNQARYMK